MNLHECRPIGAQAEAIVNVRAGMPAETGGARWLLTRDFSLVWWSQIISQIGDGVTKLALMWFVYSVPGSPMKTTVIGLLPQFSFSNLTDITPDPDAAMSSAFRDTKCSRRVWSWAGQPAAFDRNCASEQGFWSTVKSGSRPEGSAPITLPLLRSGTASCDSMLRSGPW